MKVSSCCGVPFHEPGYPDNDLCSACKEHADVIDDELDEENKRIKEVLVLVINGVSVTVRHEGLKYFKDQKRGVKEVEDYIQGRMTIHKETDGFVPYNNFECSFRWQLLYK